MKTRLVLAILLALGTIPLYAQKGPVEELGFNPQKLYEFNDIDSVNLFNGNLTLSIPLGVRYTVSSSLSYQFMLVYNAKVWDYETWANCVDCVMPIKRPNLRSNAGLGWRVTLGRLLPPAHTTTQSSFDRDSWIYEGPAGDEHDFGYPSNPDDPVLVNVPGGLRLLKIDDTTRDVEFTSGEVHRFRYVNDDWRLTELHDRYGNSVAIAYQYFGDGEIGWTVTDSVGRTHTVSMQHWSAMDDGWSRGWMVKDLYLEGVGGGTTNRAHYTFDFAQRGVSCDSDNLDAVPELTNVLLPDGTAYTFSYQPSTGCTDGLLYTLRYPTGGTVTYTYASIAYPDVASVCRQPASTLNVTSRIIADGSTSREWDYDYQLGPYITGLTYYHLVGGVSEPDPDPCLTGAYPPPPPPNGPIYSSRTSVLSPVDADGHRSRTDQYFNVLSAGSNGGGFQLTQNFGPGSAASYGYSGPAGVPPASVRKGALSGYGQSTDVASSSVGGGLATEVYDNCSRAGDCSGGLLLRTTYDTYEFVGFNGHAEQGVFKLVTTRTAFNDDNGCTPAPCYVEKADSDNNGRGEFRTSRNTSNFPGATIVTNALQYPTWTVADLVNASRPWFTTYTSKSRTEGTDTKTEAFCFDNTYGSLLRHRVLAGPAPGAHDVLRVFQYYPANGSSAGNLAFSYDYGGDVQNVDAGSDLCNIPLPAQPWYKVENTYTAGVLSKSRYYDRTSDTPLSFYSFDRDIDPWTGVATASRDTAGAATTYAYDPLPARLKSMTSAAGAVTQYTYTAASGTVGSSFTPAQVVASTDTGKLESRFVFDGIGRVQRKMAKGPDAWTASEIAYDEQGRMAWTSETESTGADPASGSLQLLYKTSYKYDALGRSKTITAPDGSVTAYGYIGDRVKTRTNGIWTGNTNDTCLNVTGQHCTTVTEQYDGFGRLVGVTEPSGPTNANSKTGSDVVTAYSYDAGGHLAAVKMTGGSVQNRIFDYDGRGFLRWESQPESSMAAYAYDPHGRAVSTTQSTANTQFDLNYTYDSAERLTRIDARNPLYDPANPLAEQPQFRPMKELVYGTANVGTDLRNGKLLTATRHNYGETISEPEYAIQDSYMYDDVAGRLTARTTDIIQAYHAPGGGQPTTIQHIVMGFDEQQQRTLTRYDDLGSPVTVAYPMCIGCGVPPTDPDRTLMTRTYAAGRLKTLSNFIDGTTYWPDGLRNQLTHTNRIVDTQTVTSMARPSQIAFGTAAQTYDRCVQPVLTTQPAGGDASSGSVTLSVVATGTGTITYQWWDVTHNNVIGATSSVVVTPTATTEYYVVVSNPCGYVKSQTAKVTVGACAAPSTGQIRALAQPDGTWIVTPNPEARQPRTYSWTRTSDNAVLGTSETLAVGILSATTTYRLTITDACGSGSATVTINIPLPITTGLQATATTTQPLQVSLTWPAIAGASLYTIERRSGAGWETAGTSSTPAFVDQSVVAARTYAYRVTSDNGGHTDYDVATTMSFVAAAPLQTITPTPFNSMLDAVNKVRAAAGWPAVSWSNILAASDPLPAPGQLITARQIMACRARMNEALQALGVVVRPYTDADLYHLTIKALYINEVEQRTQ